MKCLNCGNDKAISYYSPKDLFKYNIYLCNKCIKKIKGKDLRYVQNEQDVLRLIKEKRNKNENE